MKITKKQLKQIIKEEFETLNEYGGDEYAAGDWVEVRVSHDGYETSLEKLANSETEYQNERGGDYGPSVKMLVRVIKVAPDPYGEQN